MKIHPDVISVPSVHSYGPDWVQIADQKFTASLVMDTRGERFDWHCQRFEDLSAKHFEQIARLAPELVIFGSGARLRFVPPTLTQSLIKLQIGLDTMDMYAACRTYNILASEGRQVALALLIESDPA